MIVNVERLISAYLLEDLIGKISRRVKENDITLQASDAFSAARKG